MSTQIDINIPEYFTSEMYTGWGLANVVNNILKDIGFKSIPPQMIYQYMRNNYIKHNNKKIAREDAITWCEKYIMRKVTK